MSLCTVQGVALGYGARVLFADLSFIVGPRDRVGLVGPNGAGKSSLMKLLAGVLRPDHGSITLAKEARLGYLPQELAGFGEGTLLETVLGAIDERTQAQARLHRAEEALSRATTPEQQLALSEELSEAAAAVGQAEQLYGPYRAAEILSGLGFRTADLSLPARSFSGGWRMRAALAALLLRDPELLLLDEPTNHLDLPTLAWLDGFLQQSDKALILISHDREFLNRHINRVLAIESGKVTPYTGDYDDYEAQKALAQAQLEAKAVKIEEKRAQLERFIERFGAKNTKATQAKSKQKQIDRLEVVEFMRERKRLAFRFPEVAPSGKDVLSIQGLSKRFGEKAIYREAGAHLGRGDRIAIVGVNGAGKTTLLKLITDELPRDAGEVKYGHNVTRAYYAQHHGDQLNPENTIFQELDALVPNQPPSVVRKTAGAFLFSGDDVEKRVTVLSGGERARVALAKLLLTPSNLLLLDEPTNHLDLDSAEALIDALSSYQGTILFVSHNESFVRRLATKIWEIEDGEIRIFPGTFDEYVEAVRERRAREAAQAKAAPTSESAPAPGSATSKEKRRQEAEARQAKSVRERQQKKAIEALEAEIATLEAALREAEQQMSAPNFYSKPEASAVTRRYEQHKQRLDAAYLAWEEAQEALASLS